MDGNIPLAEKPYTAVQGEGLSVGKRMWFVRTQGCPVECNYCDSKYTWRPHKDAGVDNPDSLHMSFEDLAEMISGGETDTVWITGGEPSIYSVELLNFIKYYRNEHYPNKQFHMCTAGTIIDEYLWYELDNVVLDLKPPSAYAHVRPEIPMRRIKQFVPEIKMALAHTMEDMEYARKITRELEPVGVDITVQPQYIDENTFLDDPTKSLATTDWPMEKFELFVIGLQMFNSNVRLGVQLHKLIHPYKLRRV